MTKWSFIVDFKIIAYLGSIAGPLLILIWGEFFSHTSLDHLHILSVILTASFGAGELRFKITWYDQFICHQSYTTFHFFSMEADPFQLFSCLQLIFPYIKIYYISHINFYFGQLYKNRDIYSIVYTNKKCKWLFLTKSIAFNSKQWKISY